MIYFTKAEAKEKIGKKGHMARSFGAFQEGRMIEITGYRLNNPGNKLCYVLELSGKGKNGSGDLIVGTITKDQFDKHIASWSDNSTFSDVNPVKNPLTPEFFAFPIKIR